MCLSTLFCADDDGSFLNLRFENDVKMYGTETMILNLYALCLFENDVKMYGTETPLSFVNSSIEFENDVKMYGTETSQKPMNYPLCLRMM